MEDYDFLWSEELTNSMEIAWLNVLPESKKELTQSLELPKLEDFIIKLDGGIQSCINSG